MRWLHQAPAALLALGLAVLVGESAAAQISCDDWDTRSDSDQASAADVSRCLAGGHQYAQFDEPGNMRLHWAAVDTDAPDIVMALIEDGADLHARDENGLTPLHLASSQGHPAVVAALLEAGADPNAQRNSGGTPLNGATYRASLNSLSVVVQLLEAGADPDARSGSYGRTPLRAVAETNVYPAIIAVLLEAGADPNSRTSDGRTPLHAAAANEEGLVAVELLLRAGADPNSRNDEGSTPLHEAMVGAFRRMELTEGASRLLEEAVDPTARDDEHDAIHFFVSALTWSETTPKVVAALVDAGADPNAANARNQTPLHLAVVFALDPVIVEQLLDAGADPSARTANGALPYHLVPENSPLLGSETYERLNVSG